MNQLNLSLKSNKNKELVLNGRIYQMYHKKEQNGIEIKYYRCKYMRNKDI